MASKTKRNLTPSRSVAMGAPVGGAIGVVITFALNAIGVPMTPEFASAIGTVVAGIVAYFSRGGRKGEAE